jgi:hypothetical protein
MKLKSISRNLYKDYQFGASIDYMFYETSVVNACELSKMHCLWELYMQLTFVLPKKQ